MTPAYSENPFVNKIHIPAKATIAAVHFHSGYSEFGYSKKSVKRNAVSGPPYILAVIVNFLFNAHPRAATVNVSLAIIDACGISYTAIAKEFDVAKSTMTL